MRKKVVAGNWKMNGSSEAIRSFANTFAHTFAEKKLKLDSDSPEAVLFLPALYLKEATRLFSENSGLKIQVGAQNAHGEVKGAFTGELSASMIRDVGCNWALIGHSERRQYFGETDAGVRKRATGLLNQGVSTMLCLGESLAQRQNGETETVLRRQISEGLPSASDTKNHETKNLDRLVLAYEPVWAIGTGLVAEPKQIQEAHLWIRSAVENMLGENLASQMRILYGGSVTPETFAGILSCPDVDGGLIGGASLKAESFFDLYRTALQ